MSLSTSSDVPGPLEVTDKSALARALRVSVRTINRMIQRGDLPPPIRVGGHSRKAGWRTRVLVALLDGLERRARRR